MFYNHLTNARRLESIDKKQEALQAYIQTFNIIIENLSKPEIYFQAEELSETSKKSIETNFEICRTCIQKIQTLFSQLPKTSTEERELLQLKKEDENPKDNLLSVFRKINKKPLSIFRNLIFRTKVLKIEQNERFLEFYQNIHYRYDLKLKESINTNAEFEKEYQLKKKESEIIFENILKEMKNKENKIEEIISKSFQMNLSEALNLENGLNSTEKEDVQALIEYCGEKKIFIDEFKKDDLNDFLTKFVDQAILKHEDVNRAYQKFINFFVKLKESYSKFDYEVMIFLLDQFLKTHFLPMNKSKSLRTLCCLKTQETIFQELYSNVIELYHQKYTKVNNQINQNINKRKTEEMKQFAIPTKLMDIFKSDEESKTTNFIEEISSHFKQISSTKSPKEKFELLQTITKKILEKIGSISKEIQINDLLPLYNFLLAKSEIEFPFSQLIFLNNFISIYQLKSFDGFNFFLFSSSVISFL
ncbi:protein sprint [Anaeramoeba ignava]|uniref:Protein sprint n=1 Tax=Anaeramoeba ignava TaxID=1746090 RepID=A0A9Q0LES0_ANAIG|nr:protein sprint [Anaeramoeba ignava]